MVGLGLTILGMTVQVWCPVPVISTHRKVRQEDSCHLEASLSYVIVRSRSQSENLSGWGGVLHRDTFGMLSINSDSDPEQSQEFCLLDRYLHVVTCLGHSDYSADVTVCVFIDFRKRDTLENICYLHWECF